MDEIYLVWSNEHAGWWKAGGWGYDPGFLLAGQFTRAEAIEICRKALPTALSIGTISEIPIRLADMTAMLDGQMIPEGVLRARRREF